MKKIILASLLSLSVSAMAGKYKDGTYRGNFIDSNETQVNVQFELRDDKVISSKYRYLGYAGQNFLKNPELEKQKNQYLAILNFMKDKNINEIVETMYHPEKIENAGATARVDKVRSAVKDAILRDAFSLPKK
ncbi:MAG: hypothetical protein ACRC6A_02620 [Fusobacteriaceae bacterium]